MTKEETITNHVGRNQECASSNCIPVYVPLAVLTSLYPQDDDDECESACGAVFGIVSGTLFVIGVIGVVLLGCSSFEFDTIQGNG